MSEETKQAAVKPLKVDNTLEIEQLLTDIRTVGDLLTTANNGDLLESTISNAGWFIERSVGKIQELV